MRDSLKIAFAGASAAGSETSESFRTARHDMALAGLMGGMALANAGLGAVHGFAAALGGMFPAPHGALCAALLAPALQVNLEAARRWQRDETLCRFETLARLVCSRAQAGPQDLIVWVADLTRSLQIPGLATYGICSSQFDEICLRAAKASSMRGNPVELNRAELEQILAGAL